MSFKLNLLFLRLDHATACFPSHETYKHKLRERPIPLHASLLRSIAVMLVQFLAHAVLACSASASDDRTHDALADAPVHDLGAPPNNGASSLMGGNLRQSAGQYPVGDLIVGVAHTGGVNADQELLRTRFRSGNGGEGEGFLVCGRQKVGPLQRLQAGIDSPDTHIRSAGTPASSPGSNPS